MIHLFNYSARLNLKLISKTFFHYTKVLIQDKNVSPALISFISLSSEELKIFPFNREKYTNRIWWFYSKFLLHSMKRFHVRSFLSMKQNIWIESGDSIQIYPFIRWKIFSSVFWEWNEIVEYSLVIPFENLIHSMERFHFSFLRMKQNIKIQSGDFLQILSSIQRKDLGWNLSFEWSNMLEYNLLMLFKYFVSFGEN